MDYKREDSQVVTLQYMWKNAEARMVMPGTPLCWLPCVAKSISRTKDSCLHFHDYVQVWYVIKGTLMHTVGEETYEQTAGSCMVVLPFTPHSVNSQASVEEPEVFCVSFADGFLTDHGFDFFSYDRKYANMDGERISCYIKPDDPKAEEMVFLIRALQDEFACPGSVCFEKVAGYLAGLLRLTAGGRINRKGFACARDHALAVTKAVRYMSHCFNQKITIEKLCSVTAMSKTTLVREFGRITGTTFSRLLLNIRVCHARHLLAQTDKKIGAIARESGFYDESHFVRVFQSFTQKTPLKYRLEQYAAAGKAKEDSEKWADFTMTNRDD